MARPADKHGDKKRELLSIAEKLFMEKDTSKLAWMIYSWPAAFLREVFITTLNQRMKCFLRV